jgi:hypothetical protein
MRYSLTLPPEDFANNELRMGSVLFLIWCFLGTLLATETIEVRFQHCQEKIPTCDGEKTPAHDGSVNSPIQNQKRKIHLSIAEIRIKLAFSVAFR